MIVDRCCQSYTDNIATLAVARHAKDRLSVTHDVTVLCLRGRMRYLTNEV